MSKLCPKCGSDELTKRYHPARCGTSRTWYEEEGIEHTCQTCKYEWDEPSLDKQESKCPRQRNER